jgi:tetratricopeptide (TPR) repeat protein
MEPESKPNLRVAESPSTTPPLTFPQRAAKRARSFFSSGTFWGAIGALAAIAAIVVPITINWTKEKGEVAALVAGALTKMGGEVGRIEVSRTCRTTREQRAQAEAAKIDLDKAKGLRPRNPHLITALGIYNLKLCRLSEAKKLFEAAIRRDSNLAPPHYNLGVALWMEGHTLKALNEFETARTLDPKDYRIMYNLGVVHLQAHQLKEAIENLKNAADLDPGSSEVWENLGTAYAYNDQANEALNAYKSAVDCGSDSASAHYNLGRYLWSIGRNQEAIAPLMQAKEKDPTSPVALPFLGLTLSAVGKQSEARDIVRYCTEHWSDNADCYEVYGLILQQEHNLAAAISAWERSVELDPNDKDTWRYLAGAYREKYGA